MNEFIFEIDENVKNISTSFGQMKLGNVFLADESLELCVSIDEVSDELKAEIEQKINDSAFTWYKENEIAYKERGLITVDEIKMREVCKTLNISFYEGKIKACIGVGAVDQKTEELEIYVTIPVPLIYV